MRGQMLIYHAGGALSDPPEKRELTAEPDLRTLQSIVGGYIELVPHFTTLVTLQGDCWCVAFCNENGKLNNLPVNRRATLLWDAAVRKQDGVGLLREGGQFADVLVGSIVILTGDQEFMDSLKDDPDEE